MSKLETSIKKYRRYTNSEVKRSYYKRFSLSLFSNLLFFLGITIFAFFVALPYLKSLTYTVSSLSIVTPFSGKVLSYVYSSSNNDFYFKELENSQWESTKEINNYSGEKYFYLSIPKLSIHKAKVEINSPTLDPEESLGHYKGTSLPGEVGNSFIYGHSSLPFLYDVKDYKTIFSKLPSETFKNGDFIYVDFNNETYKYKVKTKRELLPKDINPYDTFYPSLNNKSTLTLLTCTPPGFKTYRYIVMAILVE